MAASRKTKPVAQPTEEAEPITLDQVLEEEVEGRTCEPISQRPTKPEDPSKMDRAIKIMEEIWDDLQAGKVKRKDVVKRFVDEGGFLDVLWQYQEEADENRLETI